MRMNFERSSKAHRRFAKFVERHMAETLTRGGAEMISIPRQGLLAVGNRTGKVAAHEAHSGAFIPAFGELGSELDNSGKQLFGFGQFLLLHRFDAGAKNSVYLGVSRAAPRAPKQSFSSGRELRIIALQRLECFAFVGRIHKPVISNQCQLPLSSPRRAGNANVGTRCNDYCPLIDLIHSAALLTTSSNICSSDFFELFSM